MVKEVHVQTRQTMSHCVMFQTLQIKIINPNIQEIKIIDTIHLLIKSETANK